MKPSELISVDGKNCHMPNPAVNTITPLWPSVTSSQQGEPSGTKPHFDPSDHPKEPDTLEAPIHDITSFSAMFDSTNFCMASLEIDTRSPLASSDWQDCLASYHVTVSAIFL